MLEKLDQLFYKISRKFFTTPDKIEGGRQFLTFAIIGIGNTIIDFSIYIALTRHTQIFNYQTPGKYLANSISFLTATTFSFWANRTWTFRQTGWPSLSETLRFYATTLTGLLINNGVLFVLNEYIGINDIVAKIFSTVFSTTWNFIFKKFWVFAPDSTTGTTTKSAR